MTRTYNCELNAIATFNTPLERLWEAWTNPDHIVHWWGPKGFSNTIHSMDLREGGEWKFTMHGPDGKNFPNRSIFREIVPLNKIVFEHFNPHFITTVLFDQQGDHTRLDWTLLFDTPEMREVIVKVHKADEGQQENLEKLRFFLGE